LYVYQGIESVASLQFAQKAVVTRRNQILLVRKSADDPNRPGKWDLPGGRIEGAENLDSHLVREVLEETGWRVRPGRPVDVWDWNMRWHAESVRVIAISRYCELESDNAGEACREPDDYLAEQGWFTPDEVRKLDIIPSQRPTIDVVLKELEECQPARRS
jgi:8-oxo-dGTP pyrophosphatase MutT (NUDIX family)